MDYLMDQPNIVSHINPLVPSTAKKNQDFASPPPSPPPPPPPFRRGVLSLFASSLVCVCDTLFWFPPLVADDWEDTTMFSFLDTRDKTAVVAKKMKYFTRNGERRAAALSIWHCCQLIGLSSVSIPQRGVV